MSQQFIGKLKHYDNIILIYRMNKSGGKPPTAKHLCLLDAHMWESPEYSKTLADLCTLTNVSLISSYKVNLVT